LKLEIGLADLGFCGLDLDWFSRPGREPGKSWSRRDEYLNDFLIVSR
jgi:hypothetical protein